MPQTMDGIYNYRSWDTPPQNWSYTGPFADHQERMTHQALSAVHMSREEVGTYVLPPLPQVRTFRPRQGYPEYQDQQARVTDIVGTSRRIEVPASSWYSGTPAGYNGASRFATNNLGLV